VLGGVRAEPESFDAAMAQKAVLLYAPESWRGLAKGWNHRYELATFDPSFIRLSARYQVSIAPVVCLGNEFLHPWAVNSKALARWLKMPLLPVSPLLVLFILFPSLGVWAMRSRLEYYFQPLQAPAQAGLTRSQLYDQAEQLRSQLQQKIEHLISDKRSL